MSPCPVMGRQGLKLTRSSCHLQIDFFTKLLKKNIHPHPLLYMRGMNTRQLNAVLDFIYYGQVRLLHEDLDAFFILAEELELRGLSGSEKESQYSTFQQSEPKSLKDLQPLGLNKFSVLDKNRLKSKLPQVQPEATEIQSPEETSLWAVSDLIPNSGLEEQMIMVQADKLTNTVIDSNDVQLDDTIESMMERLGHGKFSCNVCGKTINHKGHMISHIEHKHIQGFSHQCPKCGKPYRSRGSLQVHVSLHHRA